MSRPAGRRPVTGESESTYARFVTQMAGAVLAAGSGSRMGGPKAELVVAGARLVDRAVRVLREAGCDPLLAVVRAGTSVAGARIVVNATPERGQRSSLELAVAAAGDVRALAVLLVDVPGVRSAAVAATVGAWTPGRVAVATYDGRRGHPIVMAPDQWRAAIALASPDEGARAFLRTNGHLVDEVPVGGDPSDLDTPEDVARWQQRRPAPRPS